MLTFELRKGMLVHFAYFKVTPTCLAGFQPKVGAEEIQGIGEIMHIYSDTPDGSGRVEFQVKTSDGLLHMLKPEWIKGIEA